MNCQDTTEFFSDYYDGGLQAGERRALEEHLKGCMTCTGEFKHFTRSLNVLHDTGPMETTAVFLTNVRAAAEQHLERKEKLLRTASESVTMVTPRADPPPPPGPGLPMEEIDPVFPALRAL